MRLRPKAFVGQVIADLLLLGMLSVVTALIGVRGIVRGARVVGILPPKPESAVF